MTVVFMSVKTRHFILETGETFITEADNVIACVYQQTKTLWCHYIQLTFSLSVLTILVYLRLYKCLSTPNFLRTGIISLISNYLQEYGIAKNDKTIMENDENMDLHTPYI